LTFSVLLDRQTAAKSAHAQIIDKTVKRKPQRL